MDSLETEKHYSENFEFERINYHFFIFLEQKPRKTTTNKLHQKQRYGTKINFNQNLLYKNDPITILQNLFLNTL